MLLRKDQGGSTVAGYEWANDGDVVEVPGDLGLELLEIRGAGFSEVLPTDEQADTADQGTDDNGDDPGDTDSADDKAPKTRRPRQTRTPVAE